MASKNVPLICPVCNTAFTGTSKQVHCSVPCGRKSPKYFTPIAKRFWRKVQKTEGCWLWTGSRNRRYKNGQWIKRYGLLAISNGREQKSMRAAHRVSWELHYGPIPDGLNVLHRCDNPPCVRPDHLFLGTQADNVEDMVSKGRHCAGRFTHDGKAQSITAWAVERGLCPDTVHKRIHHGLTVLQALELEERPPRNHPVNRPLTFNGTTMLLSAWTKQTGIHRNTVYKRLKSGWTLADAVCTPSLKKRTAQS